MLKVLFYKLENINKNKLINVILKNQIQFFRETIYVKIVLIKLKNNYFKKVSNFKSNCFQKQTNLKRSQISVCFYSKYNLLCFSSIVSKTKNKTETS